MVSIRVLLSISLLTVAPITTNKHSCTKFGSSWSTEIGSKSNHRSENSILMLPLDFHRSLSAGRPIRILRLKWHKSHALQWLRLLATPTPPLLSEILYFYRESNMQRRGVERLPSTPNRSPLASHIPYRICSTILPRPRLPYAPPSHNILRWRRYCSAWGIGTETLHSAVIGKMVGVMLSGV